MKKTLAMIMACMLILTVVGCAAPAPVPVAPAPAAPDAPASEPAPAAPAAPAAPTPAAQEAPSSEPTVENKPVNLIFSVSAIAADPMGQSLTVFKEALERISGGNMTVECYTDGVLFNQDNEHAALIDGDIDMTYSAPNWAAAGSPWATMLCVAYLYNDYAHMRRVMDSEIGQAIFDRVEADQGFKPLGSFYFGSRVVHLREDKPVMKRADLAGVNLRMPNSEAWMMMGHALGANPTPLAFGEIYVALQTGAIDGQENPLGASYNAKFYEHSKSISVTNHQIADVWPAINSNTWKSLTEQQQGWLMEALKEAGDFMNETNLRLEEEVVQKLKDAGIKFYYPDTAAYAEEALAYYLADKEYTATWDMELFEKIRAMA